MSEHDDDEARGHPIDLAAIQADDALLDAMRGSPPTYPPADEPLANVLLQWRREVDAEPIPELIDTDTAMRLMADARRPAPRRRPVLMPFAAAAAMLVVAFSGVGLAAKSAQPDDGLFPITQVLYPGYAASAEAANTIRLELQEADAALQQDRGPDAEKALEEAERGLVGVSDGEEREELIRQRDELRSELEEKSESGSDSSSESASEPSGSPESSDPVEQMAPDSDSGGDPDGGDPDGDGSDADGSADADSPDADRDEDSDDSGRDNSDGGDSGRGDSDRDDTRGDDNRDDPSTRSRPSEDGVSSGMWPTPSGRSVPGPPTEAPPTS